MPTSRKRNTAPVVPNDYGETINITNISETSSSSDSDSEPAVVAPTQAGAPVNANNAPVVVAPAAAGMFKLAPLLPSAPTARTNRAHDINYFFTRGLKTEGTSSICKTCR